MGGKNGKWQAMAARNHAEISHHFQHSTTSVHFRASSARSAVHFFASEETTCAVSHFVHVEECLQRLAVDSEVDVLPDLSGCVRHRFVIELHRHHTDDLRLLVEDWTTA